LFEFIPSSCFRLGCLCKYSVSARYTLRTPGITCPSVHHESRQSLKSDGLDAEKKLLKAILNFKYSCWISFLVLKLEKIRKFSVKKRKNCRILDEMLQRFEKVKKSTWKALITVENVVCCKNLGGVSSQDCIPQNRYKLSNG